MSTIGPVAASKGAQTFRRSRHAWATGTSRIAAPNSNFGRAPTASPYAMLAAASHQAPSLRLVQRFPNRRQGQHRQSIPTTDRHLVHITQRQKQWGAGCQAECERAGSHHCGADFGKIAPPERAQQTHADQKTDHAKNHCGVLLKQIVASQCRVRPEKQHGGRNPVIEV